MMTAAYYLNFLKDDMQFHFFRSYCNKLVTYAELLRDIYKVIHCKSIK